MRIPIAIALVFVSASFGHANKTIVVEGLGVATCAQFLQLYSMNPQTTENTYLNWSHGFMSGLNAARWPHGPYRDLNSKTVAQLNAHVRLYCNTHPLAEYMQAVMDFFMSLPLRPPD